MRYFKWECPHCGATKEQYGSYSHTKDKRQRRTKTKRRMCPKCKRRMELKVDGAKC